MSETIPMSLPRPNHDVSFYAAAASLFALSAATTVALCRSMSATMPMPGRWTMSMAWMRMPGRSWAASAGMFALMWIAMMIAMMMPALLMTLRAYRAGLRVRGRTRVAIPTSFVAFGYFAVWSVLGVLLYPAGASLAATVMRSAVLSRAMPVAMAVTLLAAGALQLTNWKARQLRRCRYSPDCCENPAADPRGALMNGVRSGVRCALCCASFTSVLVACGVMDLAVMTAVAGAITLERIGPRPIAIARAIGIGFIAAGIVVGVRQIA